MKKVKLNIIVNPDKSSIRQNQRKYSIYVRRGLTLYYASRKEAENIQNRLNSFINDQIFILNESYMVAWAMNRRLWFYFDTEAREQRKIDLLIIAIEKEFNGLIDHYSNPGSGASVTLNRIVYLCGLLLDFYTRINEMQKKRNNWESVNVIKYEIERIAGIRSGAENWQ